MRSSVSPAPTFKRLRRSLTCLAAATIALSAQFNSVNAEVKLPNIFSDHMVLQQQQANKVWGTADAGEKVTVTFGDQSHAVTASEDGKWHVMLDPMEANQGGPFELKVQGENEITISDILIGEVWICSGQSNMQWNVNGANDADLERLAAKHPNIRMINFPQVGRQETVWTHPNAKWQVCTPETVGSFSAVGYYFGRQLEETLDVPVGLINNAWGGSACEAWIPREKLEAEGNYAGLLERWSNLEEAYETLESQKERTDEENKQLQNLNRNLRGNHRPGNIYHGVLESHLGYGIRGAIWYQGESNAGRAYQYRELFPLMIQTWRDQWGEGDFPFYWVQLADFTNEVAEPGESDWAELREAQTMTMDRLPNTGQAVIIDIGEGRDIHPKNKVDVGRRLARLALANDYGIQIASQSPRYESVQFQDGKAVLTFKNVDGNWRPFDTREPVGFAIAGEDKKFVWANAKIVDGNKVEVWSDQVAEPASVRYGWANNPVCNMYDSAGLPLTPFRTDEWDGVTKNNQ